MLKILKIYACGATHRRYKPGGWDKLTNILAHPTQIPGDAPEFSILRKGPGGVKGAMATPRNFFRSTTQVYPQNFAWFYSKINLSI